MIALKVKHNGKEVSTAGNKEKGMLAFHLSTHSLENPDKLDNGYAYIQGVYGDKPESKMFIELNDLKIGDELTIKICEAENVDKPYDSEITDYKLSFWTKLKLFFCK